MPADNGSTTQELVREQRDSDKVERQLRRQRAVRRTFLVLLALLVLAGLLGAFDVRDRTATASFDGGELLVRYPGVGRPGLPVSWSIEVEKESGFSDDVTLAFDARYLGAFDSPTITPEPSSAVSQGNVVLWTFDRPVGKRLVVHVDAEFEPGWDLRREGSVQLLPGGQVVAARSFTTWKLP